jgi:hypothetical protein
LFEITHDLLPPLLRGPSQSGLAIPADLVQVGPASDQELDDINMASACGLRKEWMVIEWES